MLLLLKYTYISSFFILNSFEIHFSLTLTTVWNKNDLLIDQLWIKDNPLKILCQIILSLPFYVTYSLSLFLSLSLYIYMCVCIWINNEIS